MQIIEVENFTIKCGLCGMPPKTYVKNNMLTFECAECGQEDFPLTGVSAVQQQQAEVDNK